MTKPAPPNLMFSKRTIVLFVIAVIAATALTIEGTYYALKTFVLETPNDPLTKGDGQKAKGK
jgi:hypothetical protein